MFGFFKAVSYRAKCTEVIRKTLPSIDPQQCTEYVEDFKSLFDKPREGNFEPLYAVMFVCNLVLLSMKDRKENSLKNFDNCQLTMPITLAVVQATLDFNKDEAIKKDLKAAIKIIDDQNINVISELEKHYPEQMNRLKE